MPPLFWISGPPAAGKSTLCHALMRTFAQGIVVPVDDIREWVVSGFAGPVPWTEETESQYRAGEEAACEAAKVYHEAGFAVAIDACRNPTRIDEVLAQRLPGIPVTRVLLLPSLEENYRRAHSRTNKEFDPHFLDEIIDFTHQRYSEAATPEWLVLDSTSLSIQDILVVLKPHAGDLSER